MIDLNSDKQQKKSKRSNTLILIVLSLRNLKHIKLVVMKYWVVDDREDHEQVQAREQVVDHGVVVRQQMVS
jgi:hypothetical protein